ncbi:hypothetical protein LJR219_004784 [Phenylobacterium sp. LjRoot219]|uniref:hypothetical protein n=1 Tax=Phenylobacterium sp. LjRoot219 TaxID=3342283 RepID=UPI003ECF5F6C
MTYVAVGDGPEPRAAKATLERLVEGRQVSCRATGPTYDRVAAECTLRGWSLGQLLRATAHLRVRRGWANPP